MDLVVPDVYYDCCNDCPEAPDGWSMFVSLPPTPMSISRRQVDNVASEARDFCGMSTMLLKMPQIEDLLQNPAMERTYLSHVRLGLVLGLLSASIMLNARLQDPDNPPTAPSDRARSYLNGLTFGSLFEASALAALFAGAINYDRLTKEMVEKRAFISSPKYAIC